MDVDINETCQGVPFRRSVRVGSAFEFPGCGAVATLGLYGAVTADDGGGVLVVVGTCREHFRDTRRVLQRFSPDPVEGASLDVLRSVLARQDFTPTVLQPLRDTA